MTRTFIGFTAVLFFVTSTAAQTSKIPERPELPAYADPNDALDYTKLGIASLVKSPQKAADAFYWASRLEPSWAETLYFRRLALLLADKWRLQRYMEGDRKVIRSKEVMQIDSLQLRALMKNPFLYRKFDRTLLEEYVRFVFQRHTRAGGSQPYGDEFAVREFMQNFMREAGPSWRAWGAYTEGRLESAVESYGLAIKEAKERNRAWLYAERGRVHVLLGALDSAESDFREAIARLQKADEREVVAIYESKAVYEHSIALLRERKNDLAGAREAFGRALQEDLSTIMRTLALHGLPSRPAIRPTRSRRWTWLCRPLRMIRLLGLHMGIN